MTRKTKTKTALDTLTAVGVVRQSRSGDDSMSLDEQVEIVTAACERNGWKLADIYSEPDVSGRRPLERRYGLKRAVEDVETGRAQVVVVAYFDRLARSLKTQTEVVERVEKAGGRVTTVDGGDVSSETAVQWLSSTMLGMVAEYYSRSVGERLADSKARNVAKGVPPFPRVTPAFERIAEGPDKGRLRPSKYAPLVADACRMRVRGRSYVEIQRYLAENGLTIGLSGIESMLSSPLLVGEIHFGDLVNRSAHEPIVDRATFRKMQAMRAPKGRRGKSDRLLARLGVLVCGSCGARMTVVSTSARATNGAEPKRYPYYRCGNALCDAQAIIAAGVAEDHVRDEAVRLAEGFSGRANVESELETARVASEQATERLSNAIRTLAGFEDEAATRETLDDLQAKRDRAIAEHDRLRALTGPTMTVTAADWDDLSLDERRDLIRATIERAVVAPGRGADRVSVFGKPELE